MSLSKERMEKELAGQKYRAEKIEKEAAAQRKKAEAIAHLESQGQRVEGVIGFSKKLELKTSDNTLSMLLSRKAATTASEGEKLKEQQSKAALIRQQEDSRRSRELKIENDSLPPPWQSLFDNGSSSFYYWNKITNETSWTKPVIIPDAAPLDAVESVTSSSSIAATVMPTIDLLLDGWEEKKHPATQQSYYINLITRETRSIKPTLESMVSSSSSAVNKEIIGSSSNKRPSIASQNGEFSKYRKFAIDPLDVSQKLSACNAQFVTLSGRKISISNLIFSPFVFLFISLKLNKVVGIEGTVVLLIKWLIAQLRDPSGSKDLIQHRELS